MDVFSSDVRLVGGSEILLSLFSFQEIEARCNSQRIGAERFNFFNPLPPQLKTQRERSVALKPSSDFQRSNQQ